MPKSSKSLEVWCRENNCTNLLNHLVDKNDKSISYSSHKKIKWFCDLGHPFTTDPCKFTNPARCRGKLGIFKCPICNGQTVLEGFNDLATTRPDLAQEWNYERNTLLPTQVTAGSHKDVWWKCTLGHEWVARISARDYKNGCPYCSKVSRTSLPEQILFYYCKKHFLDALNMYSLNGVSYDICIPSRRIVIEYDGSIWHENKDTFYKFSHARDNGYTLYKLSGVSGLNEPNTIYFNDSSLNIYNRSNVFTESLYKLLRNFGIIEDFGDYNNAYIFAKNQKVSIDKDAICLPSNLEFEWSNLNGYPFNYCKNDGCNKYWRCFNGHTFERRLDVIRRGNITCPFCHNKKQFQYKCLGSVDNLYIILDVATNEVEFLTSTEILNSLSIGLNIQGVFLINNILSYNLDYIYNMKPTTFRLNFDKFIGIKFKCLNINYTYYIDCLTKIFSLGSAEYIHKELNKFLK